MLIFFCIFAYSKKKNNIIYLINKQFINYYD